jgi:hypothetical protein
MIWAQLLAYVTGTVVTERVSGDGEPHPESPDQGGRLLLTQEEKATLAEIAHLLGRKAL